MPPKAKPLKVRIIRRVVVTSAGCWEWKLSRLINRKGEKTYGQMTVGGKLRLAHRVAYLAFVGPIPDGCEVRHRCDNPPCCNPEHLELGSKSDNMRDMVDRGRCANTSAKLTWVDAQQIRRRLRAGEMHKVIAADYGISRTIVTRINLNQIWKTA